jgi:hypothetical protein
MNPPSAWLLGVALASSSCDVARQRSVRPAKGPASLISSS